MIRWFNFALGRNFPWAILCVAAGVFICCGLTAIVGAFA
jgi:hypothetical protein